MCHLGYLWVPEGLDLPDPTTALPLGCPVPSKAFPGWMRVVLALVEGGHALSGWTLTGDL